MPSPGERGDRSLAPAELEEIRPLLEARGTQIDPDFLRAYQATGDLARLPKPIEIRRAAVVRRLKARQSGLLWWETINPDAELPSLPRGLSKRPTRALLEALAWAWVPVPGSWWAWVDEWAQLRRIEAVRARRRAERAQGQAPPGATSSAPEGTDGEL